MSSTAKDGSENQPMEEDTQDEATTVDEEEEEYVVEALLDKRKRGGVTEYFIKWENYDHDQNTWEPVNNLNCASLIQAYEENEENKRRSKARGSASKRPGRTSSSALSSRDGDSSRRQLDSSDTEEEVESVEVVRKRMSKSRGQLENVPEREENIMPARPPPKGFARNLDLDTIISGIFDESDRIYFIVRWKSRGVEMIPVEELEEKAPRELCAYYRQRLYHTISSPQDKIVWELFKQSNEGIED